MFNNVGKKIKSMVKILFWVVAILSILSGAILIIAGITNPGGLDANMLIEGIVTLVIGPIAAWGGSLALYAFGEMSDKIDSIERKLGDK